MAVQGKIAALRGRMLRREVSCEEITRAYLDAIEKKNGALNAYVLTTPDTALHTARAVDAKIVRGETLAPLEGIPMTLKDNISTKGIETTCCSRILKGYSPIYNASVWEKLAGQNAVLLGKTNMDEFAMGSTCETSCFGGANNPYDLDRVAGGSSGGVASAVGGGMAAYGLGSDTGGSVRQPASFCGLVGLKPTYGAVSRYGLIAYASSFDQIGPITVTAADAAAVCDAICFYDEQDSTSVPRRYEPAAGALEQDLRGVRIGVAKEFMQAVQPAVLKAVEEAIAVYRSLGAEIVELSLSTLSIALPVYYILACAEASSNLGRYDGIRYGYQAGTAGNLNECICRTRSEGFGPEVQRRILLGTYVLSAGYFDAYYKKAQTLRGAVVRSFDEAFAKCDFLLAPTAPVTAFRHGRAAANPIETYQSDICTVPVNIAGLPALSLPCGFDPDGMPIGLQLIGRAFDEKTLLAAAHRFEQATDGAYLCREVLA